LDAKGDLAGAIAAYGKAIELDPELAEAHSNLGVTLMTKGDLPAAVAACKKAVELDPNYPKAYTNLIVVYGIKKDYDRAWEVIRAARRKGLGKAIDPRLIEGLRRASGRQE
jgi:superkiller protein 3